MRQIDIKQINDNVFETIGKEWILVAAGNKDKFNMMTASWGCLGWLWNKPVAVVFIRPERFTHELIEANDTMTLSFLGHSEEARRYTISAVQRADATSTSVRPQDSSPSPWRAAASASNRPDSPWNAENSIRTVCRQKSLSTKTFCSGMAPRAASTMCMWWKSLMPTQSKTIKKTHSLLATKLTHLNYGTRTNSSKRTSGS